MEMNIQEIQKYLPHRYPFLMIDRVLELEPGKSLVALKNVTFNEPHFTGHFPNQPIMPGVMIVEALAQATGILAFKSEDEEPDEDSIYVLVGIDKVRFKNMVEPGDQLHLEVEVMTILRGIWRFKCRATVDGKVVTTAEIMCTKKINQ